jgi:hypothetical protein
MIDKLHLPDRPASLPGDQAVALARAAAEAIRGLNHATRGPAGLGQPAAAYDVLGALSMAAARTGQALAQITRYLQNSDLAGRLGHDLGGDPSLSVDAAEIFLSDAQLSAAALAGDLDAAQQQLAMLNSRPSSRKERS